MTGRAGAMWPTARIAVLCALWLLAAQVLGADSLPGGFVRVLPAQLVWHEVSGSPGVRTAVVYGDPGKPGPYAVRVRFPPHVMDLPHFHPNARYVTVLEGTWYAGTGTHFDPKQAVALPPGSFMMHPARGPHWDGSRTDEAVVVQIMGEGPGTSTAVDPAQPDWVRVGP